MKRIIPVIIVAITIALGTYLNSMDAEKNPQASQMIEDSVGSTMAAPAKTDVPL